MRKKENDWLDGVGDRLTFLSEMGAGFVLSEERTAGPLSLPESGPDFAEIEAKIRACRRCPLATLRTNAVPGEGNRNSALMFVGEAPGRDEDAQGRPFVGRAGRLLTKIIEAMTYKREDVYITNVVKCRPPDNRTPHRDEVAKCSPYLLRQIQIINPRVIVTLGKVATDFFVPSLLGMGSLRGKFVDFQKIKVMPTFHPSYLVRNEKNREIRRMVWEDMQKVMGLLGRR